MEDTDILNAISRLASTLRKIDYKLIGLSGDIEELSKKVNRLLKEVKKK